MMPIFIMFLNMPITSHSSEKDLCKGEDEDPGNQAIPQMGPPNPSHLWYRW